MGRYTTVQSYSDQHGKAVTVSYAEATGGDGGSRAVKINKVENVMGSCAGAGSGDFHVYRAARRREMTRLETIEKQAKFDEAEAEFMEKRMRNLKEAEERTAKLAEKRKRKKLKQQMLKQQGKHGEQKSEEDGDEKSEQDAPSEERKGDERSEPSEREEAKSAIEGGEDEQKADAKRHRLDDSAPEHA